MTDPPADAAVPPPLCFVLMPFGRKDGGNGTTIDFDEVYRSLIAPAVRAADLEPLRADEEMAGGVVHKPMFERLLLCDYAVADLTLANANVYYELGVRHAVRPHTTAIVFAAGVRLPFDVALDRGMPYTLDDRGELTDVAAARSRLTDTLVAARESTVDSPVFQLLEGFPDIARDKTDVFRDRVAYSETWRARLAQARADGPDAVRAAADELGVRDVEAGILVDLFLSYRAVRGYQEMVDLAGRMPRPLHRTPMVREQLGFALNRLGRRREAVRVLEDLIHERGPSSETYGILGRVHKDLRDDALARGDTVEARGHLRNAIGAYLDGFEADWRDAYPGVNAVTLMELAEPPDPRRGALVPVVSYAVDRRRAGDRADYWDHATAVELAVLARDEQAADDALAAALAAVREDWEPGSTANNLRLIREARARRGEEIGWARAVEDELLRRAGSG